MQITLLSTRHNCENFDICFYTDIFYEVLCSQKQSGFFGPPSRIDSLLRRADARGSADIIYRIRRISLLCGSGI